MSYNGPRFPLEPLLARFDSCADLGRAVGVNRRSVYDKQKRGGLTLATAEEWCDRLRVHPSEVWPTWAAAVVTTIECAAPDCAGRFLPTQPGQGRTRRFCSEACRVRTWKRRKYQKDPEFRERLRRRRRAYYAENGAYERAQQARRDQARRSA